MAIEWGKLEPPAQLQGYYDATAAVYEEWQGLENHEPMDEDGPAAQRAARELFELAPDIIDVLERSGCIGQGQEGG